MRSARRPSSRRRRAQQIERLHGRHVIEAALTARRRELHRLLVRKGTPREDLEPLVGQALDLGLPVVPVEPRALGDLAEAGEAGIQGMVLEAGPLAEVAHLEEMLDRCESTGEQAVWLVALDGVEDPRNLGAIARVAEAAGVSGLLLTDRRSPPLGPTASRASAGALEWLPVCRVPNLGRALEQAKQRGFWVVAADPDAESTVFDIPDRLLSGNLIVVLGAEGRGIRPSIRQETDHPIRIPMRGRVESLNVASAAAVVLFEMLRRAESAGRPMVQGDRPAGPPDAARPG